MRIEIWSDVVCPWCYIGKRRLEAALARFPHADDVQVVWRSFELDPTAPPVREVSNVERLAHKYGVSVEQAQAMLDRMTSVAEGEDLHFRLDVARSGNTFDAHRLLHLAAERGVQDDLKEALLAAYQTEGEAISNHEVLTKRAVGVGLDETEVRDVLAGDRYGVEVRRDEAEARGPRRVGGAVLRHRPPVRGIRRPGQRCPGRGARARLVGAQPARGHRRRRLRDRRLRVGRPSAVVRDDVERRTGMRALPTVGRRGSAEPGPNVRCDGVGGGIDETGIVVEIDLSV